MLRAGKGLPVSTRLLLLHTAACTLVGTAVLLSLLIKGCGALLPANTVCSSEQWQALAAALVAQISLAGFTLQAVLVENGCQLQAAAFFSVLSGLLWVLLLAVVGQTLAIGSRVGWGILVVFCTALYLLLLRLSYHQLGWRQHSWLSCDLRRKYAAEQQQFRHALNLYKTYSRSCMHVLVLSLVNGLVLALASNPAGSTGVVLTGPDGARFLTAQDSTPEERMQQARIGILISVGLTVLPMLWLALAHCTVQYSNGSRRLEEVATATVILAAVCSVGVQFYFLFDPLYAWPAQRLVIRLLLLVVPMAVWMVLLALTCLAFKRVMAILREPWVLEVATKGGSLLTAAGSNDELQVPEMLKPLMQGAWLVKESTESTAGARLASSKCPSKQSLSVTANPSSGRTSLTASNPPTATTSNSPSTSLWQAVRSICSSRQHYRFFQLSLDATTLRWSWNKYILIYGVESLSSDPAQLTIVLHCVLEPDLQLTFQDTSTWSQWLEGLQLALQLVTGVHVSTGAAGKATDAHAQEAGMLTAAHALEQHHQMVKAALHTGQGVQQLQAGHSIGCKGGASWLAMGPLLSTSRRYSQCDPAATKLLQAQEMAQHIQAAAAACASSSTLAAGAGLLALQLQAPAVRQGAELLPEDAASAATEQHNTNVACLQAESRQTAIGNAVVATAPKHAAASAQAVFGAFKIPAGLCTDLMLNTQRANAAYSSSGGSGSAETPGADSKGVKHAVYTHLPTALSSSAGAKQQAQVYSVLNAGYCLSPLSVMAAQRQEQQQHQLQAAVQHLQATLPLNKQRQLMQWLQQQNSGSCPDSDGPQMSPCYSLDSALLQQGSAGGSAHGMLQPQMWSAAGSGAHWAAQQRGLASTAPNGVLQQGTQHAGSPLAPAFLGSSAQQQMPHSRLGITRSISLPAEHAACAGAGAPALHMQETDSVQPAAEAAAYECAGAGQDPGAARAQPSLAMQDSASPNSSAESQSTGSQDGRQHIVLGANTVRRLGTLLQAPEGDMPAQPASVGPESAQLQGMGPAGAEQQGRWGAASFRSIVEAVSSVVRPTRDRTVSFAGNISAPTHVSTAAEAPAASRGSSKSGSPDSAQPDSKRSSGLLNRIGSVSRSVRSKDSSFSSRQPLFYPSRTMPWLSRDAASFTARNTWSDCNSSYSFSTASAEGSITEPINQQPGTDNPATEATEPAVGADDCAVQQQIGEQGWRLRSSKEIAAGLTPALSANSEDLQKLASRERSAGSDPGMHADAPSAADCASMPAHAQLQDKAQQQAQLGEPEIEEVLDMHEAYQRALRSSASETGRKPHLQPRADAAVAAPPKQDNVELHSSMKLPEVSASRTQSWLIPSAPAASVAASGAAPPLSVRVPCPMGQPDGRGTRGPRPGEHEQHNSSHSAASVPHSASAPQLHNDSYAVRSPAASVTSLNSHFSQTSIASYWWLNGCGGSPTSARSRQNTPLPVQHSGSTQTSPGCHASGPSSSIAAGAAGTGFKFPSALEVSFSAAGTPAGLQSPSLMPAGAAGGTRAGAGLPMTAALSERISAALAVGPAGGSGASCASSDAREAARRLSNTASLRRGEKPQLPVEVIPWEKLRLGRRLGQGSEGTVLEAKYKDAPVAVKEGVSESEIDMYLSCGGHDNLVGLRGLTQKADGTFCLVLEHCNRGSLDTLIHHFRTPIAHAPPSLPPPTPRQLVAAAAAAAVTAADSSSDTQQEQQLQKVPDCNLTRPDVPKMLKLMRGVARGLLHLHTCQPAILHRDIKPANIFLGNGMQMKVGDLGMARHVFPPVPSSSSTTRSRSPCPLRQDPLAAVKAAARSPQHSHGGGSGFSSGASTPRGPATRTFTPGIVGTITYSAPEVLGVLNEPKQQPDVETVLKADVYSFGVMLWESVERKRPWADLDTMVLWAWWLEHPTEVRLPPLSVRDAAGTGEHTIFAALQQLVSDCTALAAEQRPTMEQVLGRISSIQIMYAQLLAGPATAATATAEVAGHSGSQGCLDDGFAVDSRIGSPDAADGDLGSGVVG